MARVLVVDDTKIMRKLISKYLTDLGHEVLYEASNGYEALEKYKQHHEEIDFITMDIGMPSEQKIKNGTEAIKLIKIFDNDCKIIVVSSHSDKEKVLDAIKAGASNFILKPVHSSSLKESIEKIGI